MTHDIEKEIIELEEELDFNEWRLTVLYSLNRYVYTDERYPKLYPEAARLERRQDRIIERLEELGDKYL